jgi:hypothetical protein
MLVSENGYKKISNFLESSEIFKINSYFNNHDKLIELDKKSTKNKFGDIYNKVNQLVLNQKDYNVTFSKLWLVRSNYSNVDRSKLPYLPHFDRLRFLKVMIYLCDTDSSNGAFFASSCNTEDFESARRMLPVNHKEMYLNNAANAGEFKPIEGRAGDAIIFDTNCPHFAGFVEKGKERKIARFDYHNKDWNKYWKYSKLAILKKNLKSTFKFK